METTEVESGGSASQDTKGLSLKFWRNPDSESSSDPDQKPKHNESNPSSDADSKSKASSNTDSETDDIFKKSESIESDPSLHDIDVEMELLQEMPKLKLTEWDLNSDIGKMPLEVKPKAKKKVLKAQVAENANVDIQGLLNIQHSRYHQDFSEIQHISDGGFGHVYMCTHKRDHKAYAIKKIAFSESEQENAYGEVIAHSSMQFMHVVQFHESWVEEGCYPDYEHEPGDSADRTLFIQMELCGRSLKQMLDDNIKMSKSLERQHILLFTKQILMALEHIHSSGYIHGDISRSNIFFNKDENMIKIGDFGLARKLIDGEAVVDGDEWGALMYKPTQPEVGRKKKNVKSDMFSTGLVLYDIWYQFKTHREREQVFNEIRLGILPPTMHQFHRYLLAYNPLERPTVEEALADFNTHFGPELVMNVGV